MNSCRGGSLSLWFSPSSLLRPVVVTVHDAPLGGPSLVVSSLGKVTSLSGVRVSVLDVNACYRNCTLLCIAWKSGIEVD